MMARVSSTLRVVWVTKASGVSSAMARLATSLDVLDQIDRPVDLAAGALDLGMAGMADQDQLAALAHIALALDMHLGHQGAGRIEDGEPALGRIAPRPPWRRHGR